MDVDEATARDVRAEAVAMLHEIGMRQERAAEIVAACEVRRMPARAVEEIEERVVAAFGESERSRFVVAVIMPPDMAAVFAR